MRKHPIRECTASTDRDDGDEDRPEDQLAEPQYGPEDVLLPEKQLAERWGVGVKKLQADRGRGTGPPYVRLIRSVRYRLSDVRAYENANLRRSTSDTGGE